MTRFSLYSLRTRLIFVVLLAVIPMIALTVYTASEERRREIAEVQDNTMRLAGIIAIQEEQVLITTLQLLIALSHVPSVTDGNPAACNALFSNLREKHYQRYANIGAAKPNGDVFCSASSTARHVNIADRDYFKNTIKRRDFSIGDYQIGRITGQPVVVFSYPVIEGKENLKGVVFTAMDLQWFNKFEFDVESQLPKDSTLTKIDSRGIVLANHFDHEELIGKPFPMKSLLEIIKTKEKGIVETNDSDGKPRIYAFRPLHSKIASGKMYVIVGIPTEVAFAEINHIMMRNLFLIGLVALFVLAAVWFGSNRLILQPVNALVDATRRLSSGDLGARSGIPYQRGELGELSRAFDDMAGTLQRQGDERKQAEKSLAESEMLYRNLFECNPHPMWVYDLETLAFLAVNDAAIAHYGYNRDEFLTMTIQDIRPPEDMPRLLDNISRVSEGIDHAGAWLHFKKDGSTIMVEITSHTLDFNGRPAELVLAHDITDHKKAEEELRSVTQRLKLATQSARLGIWDWDVINNIMVWDDLMLELYGLTLETFAGNIEAWQKGLHPEDRNKAIEECHAALRGEKEWNTDFRVVHPDGTVKQIKANGIVFRNSEGNPVRVIGINFDITEHRKLEDQLRHAQKMEAIGTLAGGIAHDFNNILSAIIGYGHITLMKMRKDDPLRMNIEHMLEGADRAALLTQSILTFSRKQITVRTPVDLNTLLKKVEKFLIRVIGEDVAVHLALAEGALTTLADAGQLEQVFMNLATNARDAMPNGGSFMVETSTIELDNRFVTAHGYGKPGSYAMISVTDTGMGMDEETRKKIFEPFFTTKELGKGTGLGLAMVYGILKQNDGFINVYSEPGKGTTFRIYLPLIKAAAAEGQKAIEVEYPKGGKETILVAEDDPSLRKLTVIVLEQMGYTVITANDGEEAVAKFMENKDRIRLLLLDGIMPKKSGREAYEEIRKVLPNIPVLFASGYSQDMLQQKGLASDGSAFIYKPVSPMALLKKVREMLDRHK